MLTLVGMWWDVAHESTVVTEPTGTVDVELRRLFLYLKVNKQYVYDYLLHNITLLVQYIHYVIHLLLVT